MPYLIDDTFFIGSIEVSNLDEANSKSLTALNRIIDEKCRLLLLSALSLVNFQEMDSFLVNGKLPDVPESPEVDPVPLKWRNLITGCNYTVDGVTKRWKGLYFTEGTYKGSVLANYCFTFYLEENVSYQSGVGEVKAEAKNARGVNSTQKYTTVWNEFLEMYQGSDCYRMVGNIYHVGIPQYDGYYLGYFGNNNNDVSLLQFLSENATDYPDCELCVYDVKNQLGL